LKFIVVVFVEKKIPQLKMMMEYIAIFAKKQIMKKNVVVVQNHTLLVKWNIMVKAIMVNQYFFVNTVVL